MITLTEKGWTEEFIKFTCEGNLDDCCIHRNRRFLIDFISSVEQKAIQRTIKKVREEIGKNFGSMDIGRIQSIVNGKFEDDCYVSDILSLPSLQEPTNKQ